MSYEGEFKSFDGQVFFERRWDAAGEAVANLVLIHGFGEHCSRYDEAAQVLAENGITVHSYDQRGYGKSPGKRAYIADFEELLKDLDAYLAHIEASLAGKPRFMMGHSMGGMVLARYMETRDYAVNGLVFSSPFLAIPPVSPVLLALANVLSVLTPWLPVGGVDNQGLSRDPAVIAAADNDPLCFHGKVAARTGAQFSKTIAAAHAAAAKVRAPAYIIHGDADQVVPCAGSQRWYAGIASQDKTLKLYEGGYHELWNDLVKAEMLAGVAAWIRERSK